MSAIPTTSLKAAGGNLQIRAALTAALVAGSIVQASIQWTPRIAAANEIIIPTSELWLLTDLYTNSTANAGGEANPQVNFYKDNDRLLDSSHYLLSVLVTSNQRPNGLHGNLQYEGGSHMSATVLTSAADAAVQAVLAIAPYEKSG